jgi:hypothetical protein
MSDKQNPLDIKMTASRNASRKENQEKEQKRKLLPSHK